MVALWLLDFLLQHNNTAQSTCPMQDSLQWYIRCVRPQNTIILMALYIKKSHWKTFLSRTQKYIGLDISVITSVLLKCCLFNVLYRHITGLLEKRYMRMVFKSKHYHKNWEIHTKPFRVNNILFQGKQKNGVWDACDWFCRTHAFGETGLCARPCARPRQPHRIRGPFSAVGEFSGTCLCWHDRLSHSSRTAACKPFYYVVGPRCLSCSWKTAHKLIYFQIVIAAANISIPVILARLINYVIRW